MEPSIPEHADLMIGEGGKTASTGEREDELNGV